MTRYLVAIYHPDNCDPSVETEVMSRDIDTLNEEMVGRSIWLLSTVRMTMTRPSKLKRQSKRSTRSTAK